MKNEVFLILSIGLRDMNGETRTFSANDVAERIRRADRHQSRPAIVSSHSHQIFRTQTGFGWEGGGGSGIWSGRCCVTTPPPPWRGQSIQTLRKYAHGLFLKITFFQRTRMHKILGDCFLFLWGAPAGQAPPLSEPIHTLKNTVFQHCMCIC